MQNIILGMNINGFLTMDFFQCEDPPTLHKHSAVVGSRHPTPEALTEVKRLFHTTSSLENILDRQRNISCLLPEHGD